MSIKFNLEKTIANGKFSKELKIAATIKDTNGNPKEVTLGYIALFDNNDILTSLASMSDEQVQGLASKLNLSVQDAGIRQPKLEKRKIEFI